MCNTSGVIFIAKNLHKDEVEGKRILEIGSYDINGGIRSIYESFNPQEYIGIDLEAGPGVDVVSNAEDIIEVFGKESFDIVISTEVLEHVENWKKIISNIKNVCKKNGIIILSTRSYRFPYHGHPHDFWRFELEDMNFIFSDCNILSLEKDFSAPGIFVKLEKPNIFNEKNLDGYELYNIIKNKKISYFNSEEIDSFYFRSLILKRKYSGLMGSIFSLLSSFIRRRII